MAIALPSVQSLLLQLAFGDQVLGTGTGFVVQSSTGPMLITNRHNVTGRRQDNSQPLSPTGGVPDRVNIVHNVKDTPGTWVGRFEQLYTGAKARWIEHPALGARADFVALPLTNLADVQLYPYDVDKPGPGIACGPADALSVIGFPFGLQAGGSFAVWATGFMASEPEVDFDQLPVFLIDCRSRPGQSGSAVVAYRNGGAVPLADGSTAMYSGPVSELLGIYSGRLNEQSDIGFVWKISAIRDLVHSIK
jgi:hypothetical protein